MGRHGRTLRCLVRSRRAPRPRRRSAARAADWPAAGERRTSFDARWRFQKGDARRGREGGLRRRPLAGARPAARLGDRGAVRPGGQPAPGCSPVLRGGLVPQALRGAGVGPGPALRARDRRGDVERDRLPERPGARRPAVRLHRLRGRPDAPPPLRRRERRRGPARPRAGVVALVPRRGALPPRLGRRHGPGARGAVGHVRDDAGRERGRGDGGGAHRAPQPGDATPPASPSRR